MSLTNTDRLMAVAKDFLDVHISIRNKSFGRVTGYMSIQDSGSTRVLLETDTGKRIDLASYLHFLSNRANTPVFPDGTTYAQYLARPKSLYRYEVMCPANINSRVKIGEETFVMNKREK